MPNDHISSIGQAIVRDAPTSRPASPAPAEASAPAEAKPAAPPAAQDADPAVLKKATEQINEFIKSSSRNLQFSVDKGTGRIIVKVVDQESGEVIRQIPPEETLAIAKNLDAPHGVIIRSKA